MTLDISLILSSSAWLGWVLSRREIASVASASLQSWYWAVAHHYSSAFQILSSQFQLWIAGNLNFKSEGKLISSCFLWVVSVVFGVYDAFAFNVQTYIKYKIVNACWDASNWENCCFREITVPLTYVSNTDLWKVGIFCTCKFILVLSFTLSTSSLY